MEGKNALRPVLVAGLLEHLAIGLEHGFTTLLQGAGLWVLLPERLGEEGLHDFDLLRVDAGLGPQAPGYVLSHLARECFGLTEQVADRC